MGEWRRRHTVQHKDIKKCNLVMRRDDTQLLVFHLNNYISTYIYCTFLPFLDHLILQKEPVACMFKKEMSANANNC